MGVRVPNNLRAKGNRWTCHDSASSPKPASLEEGRCGLGVSKIGKLPVSYPSVSMKAEQLSRFSYQQTIAET